MRKIGDYNVDDLSTLFLIFITVQTVVFDIIFKRDSNKEIKKYGQTGDFIKCLHSIVLFFPRERIVSFVILIASY